MKYRPEIDGLRALAVLPVILFHAGFEWFNGGFVGVDVFFVISGYLITTIIISEMAEGEFSIINFYERRARRILPALFFVMAVCIPFAWMWLSPNILKDFGQSLIAVSTFSSNILFWLESGYFDTAAELKPLLHTWSLAVEEQYYILFPIFLLLTWRLGIKWILILLFCVFIISLGVAQWGAYNNPSAAFFLLPSRIWELLLGAFSAFWLKSNQYSSSILINQFLSLLGLSMIIFSIIFFDEKIPFPSLYSLIPTIGTCLLIFFAVPKTIAHRLLSFRFLVSLGLISYSAYLWHQPILAFARLRWAIDLDYHVLMSLCVASLFIAWISWRYVEKPFRGNGGIKRRTIFIFSAVGILIFSLIGFRLHLTKGELSRFDESFFSTNKIDLIGYHDSKLKNDVCHNTKGTTMPACVIGGGKEKPKIALVGDSHAYTLVEVMREEFSNRGRTFLQYTKNDCPPSLNIIVNHGNNCIGFMEEVQKDLISNSVDIVVLFSRWAHYVTPRVYENGMGGQEIKRSVYSISGIPFNESETIRRQEIIRTYIEFIETLKQQGKRVIVIGAVPEHGWSVPMQIARNYLISGEIQLSPLSKSAYDYRQSFLGPFFDYLRFSEVEFIDPSKTFCSQGERCIGVDKNGNALYWDSHHLSNAGAKLLIDQLLDEPSLIQ